MNKNIELKTTEAQKINKLAEVISTKSKERGLAFPLLSSFYDLSSYNLVVDIKEKQFLLVDYTGEAILIPFSSKKGNNLIKFLGVHLPSVYKGVENLPFYKRMNEESIKLTDYLTSKPNSVKRKKEQILIPNIKMTEVYVVVDNQVIGLLKDVKDAESFMTGKIKSKNTQFVVFKDCRPENLKNANTVFEQMSESQAFRYFGDYINVVSKEVKIKQNISIGGATYSIEETKNIRVFDNIAAVDGNANLPFGEYNTNIIREVFNHLTIIDGPAPQVGESIKGMSKLGVFSAYGMSMSMARASGGFVFSSKQEFVKYLKSTYQGPDTYEKKEKDGGFSLDVSKAHKRFFLSASSGSAPIAGPLAQFKNVKVYVKNTTTDSGLKFQKITLKNKEGKSINIALVDDFMSKVSKDQPFLVNFLDENNALEKIDQFPTELYSHPEAEEILSRNLTDGQGWVKSWVVNSLRNERLLNGNDSFQLRIASTVKGAVYAFDDICNLFDADIVLTEGMVKGKNIDRFFSNKGLEISVVGQRKDSPRGAWIASQASQQMGLTPEAIKTAIMETAKYVKEVCDGQLPDEVKNFLETSPEEETFNLGEFLALGEEFILDDRYIKDQVTKAAITQLNKLLLGKIYDNKAITGYMFSDPFAIYNAAKDGRYAVTEKDAIIKPHQVIAPIKEGNNYTFAKGEALSVRFPVTVSHEIPVVEAIENSLFAQSVNDGLWQKCIFFSVLDWTVPTQAGADHDGDSAILVFSPSLVQSRKALKSFGYTPIIPLIDAYVKIDKGTVSFGEGAPSYVPEDERGKEEEVEAEEMIIEGLKVVDKTIYYNEDTDKNTIFSVMADLSNKITLNSIENNLIGLIANRAMVTSDLLTRSVLTAEEKNEVESNLLVLAVAGRWEIDRPKHGGAYLSMPIMEELFSKYESISFNKEQMNSLTETQKWENLFEEKGVYRHIFRPMTTENKISGFSVVKPQWLAAQKDEYGKFNEDSLYQQFFGTEGEYLSFSQRYIEMFAEKSNELNKNSNNKLRATVLINSKVDAGMKARISQIYDQYKTTMDIVRNEEGAFKQSAIRVLQERGILGRKNIANMSRSKLNGQIRKFYQEEMKLFSLKKQVVSSILRQSLYNLSNELDEDIRNVVAGLYLVLSELTTKTDRSFFKDGKDYAYRVSNGYLALPFELFQEEFLSLLEGNIKETVFAPTNVDFLMVNAEPFKSVDVIGIDTGVVVDTAPPAQPSPVLKAKVLGENINEDKLFELNKPMRVAVRFEEYNGKTYTVANFLKAGSNIEDPCEVAEKDIALKSIAEGFMVGVYEIPVHTIQYDNNNTATITLA